MKARFIPDSSATTLSFRIREGFEKAGVYAIFGHFQGFCGN